MSFTGVLLVLLAVASTDTSDRVFSVERDLLPFGVPSEFSDRFAASDFLTKAELMTCLKSYSSLERTRLELGVAMSELKLRELQAAMRSEPRPEPVDELDKQLNVIEDTLASERSLMRDDIEKLLEKRLRYVAEQETFDRDCARQSYVTDDVRSLFPDGVPKSP